MPRRVLSVLGFTMIPALISSVTVIANTNSARATDGARSAAPAAPPADAVARGAYLVRFGSCNDCHTPFTLGPKGPEPDMSRALSGHPSALGVPAAPPKLAEPWVWAGTGTNTAFAGPWGMSFSANLTPDPDTGLGRWTEEQFILALRTGRHEGKGRPILPPMPYPFVASLNDDDLKAVFAYLQSLPPIVNRVPSPVDPIEEQGKP